MLNSRDKDALRYLVEKEIKEFEKEESTIRAEEVILLKGEQ